MSARVKTAIMLTLVFVVFMGLGIWLPWIPVILFGLIFLYSATEVYEALRRRLRPLALTPVLIGTSIGFAPIYIWIVFHRLSGWHAMPLRSANLDQNLVSNNAWLTSMCWLLALGLALYAFIFLLFSLISVIVQVLLRGPAYLPNAIASSFVAIFLSLPIACVCLFMYAIPNGWRWLLAIVLTASVTDISAYYAGKYLGRKKLLPAISKAKTVEGMLAAILLSGLIMGFFFVLIMRGSLPQHKSFASNFLFGLLFGIVLSLACQLGDWMCSTIKRWCELKDFSKTFPGHGGMLDRFDSLTFALPVGLFLSYLYYIIEHS